MSPTGQLSFIDTVDQSRKIWTTKQVEEYLGIKRKRLESLRNEEKLPYEVEGHIIVKHAGKQEHSPFSNLWEIQEA